MRFNRHPVLFFLPVLAAALGAPLQAAECDSWQGRHPEWIFCDDFESSGPLVANGRYFEYDNNRGDFQAMSSVGRNSSRGMRVLWQPGEVEAGNLKLGFGRVPGAYFNKGIRANEDFREVYYRMYVRSQEGWQGDPYKLSRATVLAKSDWSQAMIAHVWGDLSERLKVDPASCVDGSGNVACSGYNDFSKLKWIGSRSGTTRPFTGTNAGKWMCIEAHVKLNDAGQSNGLQEFWIDGNLEARRDNLNFVGGYRGYGINAVYFENHWNSGSPKTQERYFDNIVVSTQPIGCSDGGSGPTGIRPDRPVLPGSGTVPSRGTLGSGKGLRVMVKFSGRRLNILGRSLGPMGSLAAPAIISAIKTSEAAVGGSGNP